MMRHLNQELDIAKKLARSAGAGILEARVLGRELGVKKKKGDVGQEETYVTDVDLQASETICAGLRRAFPEHGILSEEEFQEGWWKPRYTWIIDPLDGTENFIFGGDEFGVHIGLTEEGRPVLGVNYYPVTDVLYWAVKGEGAHKETQGKSTKLPSLAFSADAPVLPLRSRSDPTTREIYEKLTHTKMTDEEFDKRFKYIASTGLRLCMMAEGVYNLLATTGVRGGLWDFLSGDVILTEAGGFISDWQGRPIDYRHPRARLSQGVVAAGSRHLYERALALLK